MRQLRIYCGIAVILLVSPASGQISNYQRGPGPIHRRVTQFDVMQQSTITLEACRELHTGVISTRVDAKVDLKKYPKEAQLCIDACNQLEDVIRQIYSELYGDGLTQATFSAYKQTSHRYLIASRDFYRVVDSPPRPYKMAPAKPGYGRR